MTISQDTTPTLDEALALVRAGQELPAPSRWHLEAWCSACGHVQYPYAVNPEFEGSGEDLVLTSYSAGSGADFCDVCEEKGLPALTMETVGFLHADQLPA